MLVRLVLEQVGQLQEVVPVLEQEVLLRVFVEALVGQLQEVVQVLEQEVLLRVVVEALVGQLREVVPVLVEPLQEAVQE